MLNNFLYFENARAAINLNETVAFLIEKRFSNDAEVEVLVFRMKNKQSFVIWDSRDIANFEQNHL